MASDSDRPHFFSPVKPVLISVVLLTLAFAPVNLFFLAWVGLAPWLLMVHECRSPKAAFFWSWIGGTIFFTANMWWLAWVSVPGMIALMVYCGLYWGIAAVLIRRGKLLDCRFGGVVGIAAIWTGWEWIRGHFITGLPLFYLGHSQTSFLWMCQIADFGGAYAVTFVVVFINAAIATTWANRGKQLDVAGIVAGLVVVVVGTLGYGVLRLVQTPGALTTGPVVVAIQANVPQSNSGEKGESDDDLLKFHVDQTLMALRENSQAIDLAVWSETMLPPINREALDIFDRLATPENDTLSAKRAHDAVAELAGEHHLALLVGADYFADWTIRHDSNGDYWVARDRRNTAYFFDQQGNMDDSLGKRYDKIHLVPFGEFIPFKKSLPFLYRILVSLGPKYYEDYELQPGDENALTVFNLTSDKGSWRFVTPICFEDIDANICRTMFRPSDGGAKRADFLVNLTNDGWFKANENSMHLQASIFRCIENRAPMVRSVNTGISGFIDSTGGTGHLLSPRTAGWSAQPLMIDRRVTFYTRFGDWFADACLVVMVLILAKSVLAKKVLEPMS